MVSAIAGLLVGKYVGRVDHLTVSFYLWLPPLLNDGDLTICHIPCLPIYIASSSQTRCPGHQLSRTILHCAQSNYMYKSCGLLKQTVKSWLYYSKHIRILKGMKVKDRGGQKPWCSIRLYSLHCTVGCFTVISSVQWGHSVLTHTQFHISVSHNALFRLLQSLNGHSIPNNAHTTFDTFGKLLTSMALQSRTQERDWVLISTEAPAALRSVYPVTEVWWVSHKLLCQCDVMLQY